jgi:fatty-acyl-CoA synthase
MLSQRNLVQQTFSHLASWGIPEEPRYLAAGSITHASGLPVVPTLLRGGTVVLMSAFDPSAWLHLVESEHINYAFVVPTMLYSLLDEPSLKTRNLSSLHTVNYGAAPMAPTRLKEGIDRIGPVFQEVYGQTEVLGVGTTLRRDEHDVDDLELLTSCGRSVAGAEVQVFDESMERVEAGEVGELCIRTRAAMIGYHNRPEESAQALRNGWVCTGDMARQDDRGFFYLVDRKKDMIVSGGYNVFSREVEASLETHPAVKDVAVIAIPDEKWGEAVCAVVVRRSSVTASEPELVAHVRSSKGSIYAPKKIVFADDLPTTALGKVDKKALREPYWQGHTRSIH